MVKPAGEIAERKGKVYQYLMGKIQLVALNAKKWRAFKLVTGLTKDNAKALRYLSNGQLPEVHPTSKDGKDGKKINGCFRHNEPLKIFVHTRVLNAYIHGKANSGMLLESTVMHELVHYVRKSRGLGKLIDPLSEDLPIKYVGREAGKLYEELAYDGDVTIIDGVVVTP